MVEIVFYAPARDRAEDKQLPSLPVIQHVSRIKVLDVTISNHLSMVGHVSALLDTCKNTVQFAGSPSPWSSPRLSGQSVLLYGTGQAAVRKSCMVRLAADIGKLDRFLNICRKLYCCQNISELFSLAA